jgi:hypothetical protein
MKKVKLILYNPKESSNIEFESEEISTLFLQNRVVNSLNGKTELIIENGGRMRIVPYKILKHCIIYINEIEYK